MPRKSHNKKGKSTANVKTVTAPTMNGMQQVNSWNMLDIVPITVTSASYVPTEPAIVQFQAGANGWEWSVA
jgi:hypothetical protein